MAFRDIVSGVKNFFGPNNTFFNGAREESVQEPDAGFYPQQNAQPAPAYAAPQQPYAQGYPQQPQAYAPPQADAAVQRVAEAQAPVQGYPPVAQQSVYQQPQQAVNPYAPNYAAQPAAQQQMYQHTATQQGYQPPQQTVNQSYVLPRNRRSAQHAQAQQQENVVAFPASAQMPEEQPQTAAQPQQPAAAQKQPAACVVNVRSIADCRSAIGILRTGDCVLAVMDNIADQAEVRRYVDTLNGACFSLGCTMTRLSARVGVYLLAPVGMQVYTDQATTQMNSQSRAPQRARSAQPAYRAPYQTQPAPAYAAQQSPYQAASPYQQYAAQPQPAFQPPAFSAQQPTQGYTPDAEPADFGADAVM